MAALLSWRRLFLKLEMPKFYSKPVGKGVTFSDAKLLSPLAKDEAQALYYCKYYSFQELCGATNLASTAKQGANIPP